MSNSRQVQLYVERSSKEENKRVSCKRSLNKTERINEKLGSCGKFFNYNISCKHCDSVIEDKKRKRFNCRIKFCNKPECKSALYKQTYLKISRTKRLKNLNNLIHCAIGFPKIQLFEFQYKIQKQKLILNEIKRRMKRKGFDLNAIVVQDLSKGENKGEWEKNFYIHYHFGFIPTKSNNYSKFLTAMQEVREELKNKMEYHFQSFGLKSKKNVLAYLCLRAVGLFKKYETDINYEKTYDSKGLVREIKSGKFMMYQDFCSTEKYAAVFYSQRSIWVWGKEILLSDLEEEERREFNPNGSNMVNELLDLNRVICPKCGLLGRHEFRIEIKFEEKPPT